MLKKGLDTWLNNGVYPDNSEMLNRKIRMSNLIAGITILVLMMYIPLFLVYRNPYDLTSNFIFLPGAIINYPLLRWRKYKTAFVMFTTLGYVYMISGGFLYGIHSHLHYFLVIMCIISSVMFDNKVVIKMYMAFAILGFFSVEYFMKGRAPLITDSPEMIEFVKVVSYSNLLVLFVIICVFILFFKNDNLRYQEKVIEQNRVIAEKNKEMTDSINYAQRLQNGLLPSKEELDRLYPGSFIFYSPKDIVSGDFYWFHRAGTTTYIACGDCTGHGVPGALMSVLGINLLTEIIEGKRATEPAGILDLLRTGIIRSLNKDISRGEYKDGMDISLVKIDAANRMCTYAGANNPLYHLSGGQLTEYKAGKQPVGYSPYMKPFEQSVFSVETGDHLVFFTDGYADQFGGRSNKKYMYKPFKELIRKVVRFDEPGRAENMLRDDLKTWRGHLEQVDDVCVIGIKL